MPTLYRMTDGMKSTKKRAERHKTGPKGEQRPMSETGNSVRVMEIATGIVEEEEYTNGRHPESKQWVRI